MTHILTAGVTLCFGDVVSVDSSQIALDVGIFLKIVNHNVIAT